METLPGFYCEKCAGGRHFEMTDLVLMCTRRVVILLDSQVLLQKLTS